MSEEQARATTIPARVTTSGLADAIGRPIEEVRAVLEARDETSSPDEMLSPDLAVAVAKVLGAHVVVEPRDLALETLYELDTRGEQESEELTGQGRAPRRGSSGKPRSARP